MDSSKRKKIKVYLEEVKQRHTSHWDLDYMSYEEMQRAYRDDQDPDRENEHGASS